MIASDDSARHEEAWLSLPWLANGRLSQAERDKIEPHVRTCAACREELAFQRLLCNVHNRAGSRDLRAGAVVPQAHGSHRRCRAAGPQNAGARARPRRSRCVAGSTATCHCGVHPDSRGRRPSFWPSAWAESRPRSTDRRSRCTRHTPIRSQAACECSAHLLRPLGHGRRSGRSPAQERGSCRRGT